jgi:hypothetical protein
MVACAGAERNCRRRGERAFVLMIASDLRRVSEWTRGWRLEGVFGKEKSAKP